MPATRLSRHGSNQQSGRAEQFVRSAHISRHHEQSIDINQSKRWRLIRKPDHRCVDALRRGIGPRQGIKGGIGDEPNGVLSNTLKFPPNSRFIRHRAANRQQQHCSI